MLTPAPSRGGPVDATEMPLLLTHGQSPWVTGALVGASPDARLVVAPAHEIRLGAIGVALTWRTTRTT